MITLGKTIAAGSTSKITVKITDDEGDYLIRNVLYKVQAQNETDLSWVDVGTVVEQEVSGTDIEVVLTAEQTAVVPGTTSRRRLILQAFYDDGNGTTLNNTESLEFELSVLPVLTEEVAPTVGDMSFTPEEPVDTGIGTKSVRIAFDQPLVSCDINLYHEGVVIPFVLYPISDKVRILTWSDSSTPDMYSVDAISIYGKTLNVEIPLE